MGQEAIRHFNKIINDIADVPSGITDTLRNYLFAGDSNPDKTIANEYVKFVMDLSAGQPIDETLLVRSSINNSRGGNGIGATEFKDFWIECMGILLVNSATEERRQS